jgi:hypothetical protein
MPNQLITAMYVSCRHDLMAVRVQPEIWMQRNLVM